MIDSKSNLQSNEDNKLIQARITMRVPQNHHKEPIISRLVSEHGLTVNIVGAILGENAKEDGWFNLELEGTNRQIQSAFVYLNGLDLEIWDKSKSNNDIW